MCRKGNDLVRAYLWNAARVAIQHNPAVRALYRRLRANQFRPSGSTPCVQDDVTNLSDRQQWILDELQAKGEMRKGEVFRGYQKQFRRSKSAIWRAYVAAT